MAKVSVHGAILSDEEITLLTAFRSGGKSAVAVWCKPAKVAKVAEISPDIFWATHACATANAAKAYGTHWYIKAPTVCVTVPTKLATLIGKFGGKIKVRRDWRMPAPEYWPEQVIPGDVVFAPPPPASRPTDGILEWTWLAHQEQIEADQMRHCKPNYPSMGECADPDDFSRIRC